MGDFSHLALDGKPRMVDVSIKATSHRKAAVIGEVSVSDGCINRLSDEMVLGITNTAKVAGIYAAKQAFMLIPLCHQIPLSNVEVAIDLNRKSRTFFIRVQTSANANTGVEMEGMAAATAAGLTIYDMVKAVDPEAKVGPFRLEEKTGGAAGHWIRSKEP